MNKLLTIVVPVYKVEPYINKCLDSCVLDDEKLMNQLEVIIVNDGTPDNSAEMSREYVKRYPQTFRQIDKENGGHGSAWNVGLKEATGKYLRFLDSDDWLTNLELLMSKLEDCQADVILTHLNNYHEHTGKNDLWCITEGPFGTVSPIDDFTFDDFYGKTNVMNFLFATYRAEMLKPYQPLFMEKVMYDDSILYAIPFLFATDYVCYDMVLYNYLSGRVGQTMDVSVKKKNISSLIRTYQYEMEFITAHSIGISIGRQSSIQRIMASDSSYLLHMLVYLPWREFKRNISQYKQYFHLEANEWKRSKMDKRFLKYPLPYFYLYEKIRQCRE